ncbi:hypothetical protein N7490_002759 [Penicillium lividum]|nr:hypothetical protein N7490_002759 [Penicillium lividum]
MPPHNRTGSPAFMFDLAAPEEWAYSPGDTIIGNLVRKLPIVTPEAFVKLSFAGRVKVKIVVQSGRTKKVYRDNWQLLDFPEIVLFQGPLHLPEGSDESLSWPISVNIPYQPMDSCRQGHSQKCSFAPLASDHPIHHTLPGSFLSESTSWGAKWNPDSHEFVEYYLKAELGYNFGKHHKSHEAICPITIRPPIVQSAGVPKMFKQPRHITTQRLLPGMENADLSFKQHAQKLFSSSKVPSFHYDVLLTVPTSIQLDDPAPMPIQIQVMPNLEKTSDSIKEVAQNIRILALEATLRLNTHSLAPGNFTDSVHQSQYSESIGLGLQRLMEALEQPLVMTSGKGNEPLNIGDLFLLTLHDWGVMAGNKKLPLDSWRGTKLTPDFTTYNIQRTHQLEWRITLEIAGEKEKCKFINPVEIIAPA